MRGEAPLRQFEVGDELPELVRTLTRVQLFRYSAATWNAHRIHYDRPYAEEEGYPDVLVQSHLHGAFLTQLCTDWAGEDGRLASLEVSVRLYAVPGERLTCRGRVTVEEESGDERLFTVALEEVKDGGEVCAVGEAVMAFPSKGGADGAGA